MSTDEVVVRMRRRAFLAVASGTALAGCLRDDVDPDDEEHEPDPDPDYGEVDDIASLLETADEYNYVSFDENWERWFTFFYEGFDERIDVNRSDVPFRVHWPKGELYGVTMDHFMKEQYGYEPEAAHLRTWIRFPDDWEFHPDGLGGTKLPGFASRFNGNDEAEQGGWGGRESDGTNGWSARMFNCRPDRHPDGAGPIALGSQIYHAEADGEYGDHPTWSVPLETGTWHRIDQYVEVNTAGEPDGSYLGWVDTEPAIAIDDLYMRDEGYENIRIESLWFVCYFGGDWGSPVEQYMHFDDLQLWLWRERPGVTAK